MKQGKKTKTKPTAAIHFSRLIQTDNKIIICAPFVLLLLHTSFTFIRIYIFLHDFYFMLLLYLLQLINGSTEITFKDRQVAVLVQI